MSEWPEPSAAELVLGDILFALSDTHRRQVVAELAADPGDAERTCSSFQLPLAKSTQTHLFKVLATSGLVTSTDRGNHRTVRLRRKPVESRFPGLLALIAADLDATKQSGR